MFTEMGRAALLHKLAGYDPTLLPATRVLDMATLGGAAALHDARLGSLAPGKAADCVALDLASPNLQPLYNVVSQTVYAATGLETRLTMVPHHLGLGIHQSPHIGVVAGGLELVVIELLFRERLGIGQLAPRSRVSFSTQIRPS